MTQNNKQEIKRREEEIEDEELQKRQYQQMAHGLDLIGKGLSQMAAAIEANMVRHSNRRILDAKLYIKRLKNEDDERE